jgi:hypothetical protein
MKELRVYCNAKKKWQPFTYCKTQCEAYDPHYPSCPNMGGYELK